MITPRLEQLIWNKKAKFKTWTVGTGSAQLEVSQNKTIIVLGFDYFPFIDSGLDKLDKIDDWLPFINKEIIISDTNNRYSFLARNYFQEKAGVRPNSHFFSCYLPFIDTISLAIANIPPVKGWTMTNAKAPAGSKQQRAPLSYGNINTKSVNTITSIELGNLLNSEIRPFRDTPAGRPLSFTEFNTVVDIDNNLNNPSQDAKDYGQMQFPMITVHYVEINERLTNTFI